MNLYGTKIVVTRSLLSKLAVVSLTVLTLVQCSTPPPPPPREPPQQMSKEELAATRDYGVKPAYPIKVGGVEERRGPANERAYLSRLRGPQGQPVTYRRTGSCCPFETPRAIIGGAGLLDQYEIGYDGLATPVVLFFDMYERETPRAPQGFTLQGGLQ